MKSKAIFALIFLLQISVFAQNDVPQKYALVIGNGSYTGLSPLANPVNDANDMTFVLESLGFTVDKLLNGNLDQMEKAVERLKNRLNVSKETYGFFFYAGHGVQSGGENFLVPVDANIPNENYLRTRTVSVQVILDDFNDAGNDLNVVVLDACRDNPFGWSRSGSRGLAIINRQPADSIVVYATSAGQRASDGEGRNGVFTAQLLKNLMTPGLDVNEVFRRTGADVAEASGRQQIPAIYNQFFGIAFLGTASEQAQEFFYLPSPVFQPPSSTSGNMISDKNNEAQLWTAGASMGTSLSAPWIIGTIRGTIAPFNYSFLEIGFDAGFVRGAADIKYYSLCPFVHYSFYLPVNNMGGFYAGAGAGFLISRLSYPSGDVDVDIFAFDFITGFNLMNFLDISYTLRTNFNKSSHKISFGYIYRFR